MRAYPSGFAYFPNRVTVLLHIGIEVVQPFVVEVLIVQGLVHLGLNFVEEVAFVYGLQMKPPLVKG